MSILLIISIHSAYHDTGLLVNDKWIFVELINERMSRFGIRSNLLWFFPGGNSIKCFLGTTCLHASNGSKLCFSLVLCPLICVRNMIQFVQGLLWDGGTECQDEPGARAEFLCSRWTRNYQWRRREAKPMRLKKKIFLFKVFTIEVGLQCWVNHSKVIQFYLYTHTYMCICRHIYVCVCMYVYIYSFTESFPL